MSNLLSNGAAAVAAAEARPVVVKPDADSQDFAAVDMRTLWTAWALLAKVSEGQAVLKKEAAVVSVELEKAMIYNRMRTVSVTPAEAEKLAERDLEGAVKLALETV